MVIGHMMEVLGQPITFAVTHTMRINFGVIQMLSLKVMEIVTCLYVILLVRPFNQVRTKNVSVMSNLRYLVYIKEGQLEI